MPNAFSLDYHSSSETSNNGVGVAGNSIKDRKG
jgi:hypothetical protein